MSDKSVLCLACGRYTDESDRVGGERGPYTYHLSCAIAALDEIEGELAGATMDVAVLTAEMDWLRSQGVRTSDGH